MAPNIVAYLYYMVRGVYDRHCDPRLMHLPLVNNLWGVFAIIGIYLAFVLHYGPKWMHHRRPYELKLVMQVYDIIQVLANALLLIYGLRYSYLRPEFSLTCQPVDYNNTEPSMMRLIYASYGYYMLKYLDMLDTIFIVLRKKNSQISFLHIYHHAGMVFGVSIFMTFLAGSHCTLLGIINLFVHTVMYAYYFASSLGAVRQALRWKRYITQLQLLQFGYLTLHFLLVIVRNPCNFPSFIAFVGLTQNMFMFAMFFDFYYKTYIRKARQQQKLKVVPTSATTTNNPAELTTPTTGSESKSKHS